MYTLANDQMNQIECGRISGEDVVNGLCLGILAADLSIPVFVKLGLISINPVVGTIVAAANLACVGYYVATLTP